MPKEIIQWPNTTGFSGTELSVHWSKEMSGGYIQLGVTRHVWGQLDPEAECSPIHADHSNCAECAKVALERKDVKPDWPVMMSDRTGSDAPPVGEYDQPATVFTDEMTRDQINQMIKVLRRARDQAFGADA